MRDFHATGHGDLAGAWDEIQRPAILPHVPGRGIEPYIAEFEQIYDRGASSFPQPILEGDITDIFTPCFLIHHALYHFDRFLFTYLHLNFSLNSSSCLICDMFFRATTEGVIQFLAFFLGE